MSNMYSRRVLKYVFKTYRLSDTNHYSKLYKTTHTNNIHSAVRYRFIARRALNRQYYDNCGKYHKHCIMADGRLGFKFPFITFEEVVDILLLWSDNYRYSFSASILRKCNTPSQKNIIKLLGLKEEFITNFDMIICKYWLLTYDINTVFDLVFKQKQPLTPFINLIGNQKGTQFSTYSVIVYRWNEINSYAIEKFINEYQDKYIPFTEITHIEYFFNCITQLLQEAFLYYRSLDTSDVWSEVYRLSWAPQLETTTTLYDDYLNNQNKMNVEYNYPDGIEPKTFLEII